MDWEAVWDVGKWVLAALAAGFIGQFGKSFALKLISRRRDKHSPSRQTEAAATPMPPETLLEQERLRAAAKTAKKLAKAEVKQIKKAEKDS